MAHYAKVLDGKVLKVIVAEKEFFDNFIDDSPGQWVQTSYNTRGGKHLKGGTPLRKNYAGTNHNYDGVGFYEPQPYPSWTLNKDTYFWEPPSPHPNDGKKYTWDESAGGWQEVDE
tara:strand:- start:410 stop:754 length:345 start_codon:yes stop_codon:yes gene_type:complete